MAHITVEINVLFICCLFWVFRPTQEFFTHGDVTITGEGLQMLIFARHLWPRAVMVL